MNNLLNNFNSSPEEYAKNFNKLEDAIENWNSSHPAKPISENLMQKTKRAWGDIFTKEFFTGEDKPFLSIKKIEGSNELKFEFRALHIGQRLLRFLGINKDEFSDTYLDKSLKDEISKMAKSIFDKGSYVDHSVQQVNSRIQGERKEISNALNQVVSILKDANTSSTHNLYQEILQLRNKLVSNSLGLNTLLNQQTQTNSKLPDLLIHFLEGNFKEAKEDLENISDAEKEFFKINPITFKDLSNQITQANNDKTYGLSLFKRVSPTLQSVDLSSFQDITKRDIIDLALFFKNRGTQHLILSAEQKTNGLGLVSQCFSEGHLKCNPVIEMSQLTFNANEKLESSEVVTILSSMPEIKSLEYYPAGSENVKKLEQEEIKQSRYLIDLFQNEPDEAKKALSDFITKLPEDIPEESFEIIDKSLQKFAFTFENLESIKSIRNKLNQPEFNRSSSAKKLIATLDGIEKGILNQLEKEKIESIKNMGNQVKGVTLEFKDGSSKALSAQDVQLIQLFNLWEDSIEDEKTKNVIDKIIGGLPDGIKANTEEEKIDLNVGLSIFLSHFNSLNPEDSLLNIRYKDIKSLKRIYDVIAGNPIFTESDIGKNSIEKLNTVLQKLKLLPAEYTISTHELSDELLETMKQENVKILHVHGEISDEFLAKIVILSSLEQIDFGTIDDTKFDYESFKEGQHKYIGTFSGFKPLAKLPNLKKLTVQIRDTAQVDRVNDFYRYESRDIDVLDAIRYSKDESGQARYYVTYSDGYFTDLANKPNLKLNLGPSIKAELGPFLSHCEGVRQLILVNDGKSKSQVEEGLKNLKTLENLILVDYNGNTDTKALKVVPQIKHLTLNSGGLATTLFDDLSSDQKKNLVSVQLKAAGRSIQNNDDIQFVKIDLKQKSFLGITGYDVKVNAAVTQESISAQSELESYSHFVADEINRFFKSIPNIINLAKGNCKSIILDSNDQVLGSALKKIFDTEVNKISDQKVRQLIKQKVVIK